MVQPVSGKNGYFAIFAVIIVGFITLTIVLSFSALNYKSVLTNNVFYQSNQAKSLANTCAEYALQQIYIAIGIPGVTSGTLTFGSNSCNYAISGTSPNITINAYGTVGTIVRKVKVTINSMTSKITLSNWQEVADF
jgi:hypothetical protein